MLVTDIKTTEAGSFPHPEKADLLALCQDKGPCVSAFLPPHVAGSGSRPSGDLLRDFLPQIDTPMKDELLALSNTPASPEGGLTLEQAERHHIVSVLKQTEWRIEGSRGAARLLNMNPSEY